MSSEELFALLKPTTEPLTEEALEEFLPFLETDHLEQLMKEDYTFAFLEEAAPYLSATFLAQKLSRLSQTRCLCTSWKILPLSRKARSRTHSSKDPGSVRESGATVVRA